MPHVSCVGVNDSAEMQSGRWALSINSCVHPCATACLGLWVVAEPGYQSCGSGGDGPGEASSTGG